MVCIFISLFVVVISFNFFAISYQINGINRLFLTTPISLVESSITLLSNDEEPNLYFDQEKLINKLDNYYNKRLEKYKITNYTIDYYFYDPLIDSYCFTDKCNSIVISFQGHLTFNYKLERQFYYSIKKN